MKLAAPTAYQAELVNRACNARRYTKRHKALWRGLYKQAKLTVHHYHLTKSPEEVVDYWLELVEESPSESNTVALDDLQCGFRTIAQESGAVVVPLDSLEEFGDTWQDAPTITDDERLQNELAWLSDVHPVTEHCHLPRWCDGTSNPIEDTPQSYEPLVAYYPSRR